MEIGSKWNGWTIEELIGEGSFGKVYRISRKEFGYTYESALKVIRIPQNKSEIATIRNEGMSEDSISSYFRSIVEDITAECALMSQLRGNSNIVSYEDHSVIELTDSFGWEIFIRMEMLIPLFDYLEEHTLTTREVVRLGVDICKALETCKKYNIIHRDIKPENIFISPQGSFKLGDFGIAREMEKTSAGMSKKGTFSYMAPEVYKGQPYNASVDIYSLGIVLYRFLNNNRTPFLPPYPQSIRFEDKERANAMRLRNEPMPAPCNAGEALAAVVLKACAYDPQDRYDSPTEMREALEAITFADDEVPASDQQADSQIITERSGSGAFGTAGKKAAAAAGAASTKDTSSIGTADIQDVSVEDKELSGTDETMATDDALGTDETLAMFAPRIENEASGTDGTKAMFAPRNESDVSGSDETLAMFAPRSEEETMADPKLIANRTAKLAAVSAALDKEKNDALSKSTADKDKTVALAESASKMDADSRAKSKADSAAKSEPEKSKAHEKRSTDKKPSDTQKGNKDKKKIIIPVAAVLAVCLIAAIYLFTHPVVPALIGMTAEQAQKELEDSGFAYEVSDKVFSDEVERGIVISQTVKSGEREGRGDAVGVVISRGVPVSAPDLAGMKKAAAEQALNAVGLQMDVSAEEYSDDVGKGKVISQDPEKGTDCEIEDTVSLVISKGVEQVTVPDVTGKTSEEAQEALKNAKLNAEVSQIYSSAVEAGKVVSQSAEAGSSIDKNSTVTIEVSLGSAPVKSSGSSKKKSSGKKKSSSSGGSSGWGVGF